jgi:hypothetical protein
METDAMRAWMLVAGLTMALASLPVRAADALTDAVQAAYAPYRLALFGTNSKAQAQSEQAMAAARQAWQAVVQRFASQPPAPYERDPQVAKTLNDVAAVFERAAAQVHEQELAEAHETLEQVRGLLAQLRQRNGVVVYSDHMNAYHAEMEHVLKQAPALLESPQGAPLLMERVGALGVLAQRLRSEAPAALAHDPEFEPLLRALEASIAALRRAALAQDMAAAREAVGRLKPAYSRLFLKAG